MRPMRAGVAVKGPFSGKPSTATGVPDWRGASGSGRRPRPSTCKTAMSFRGSKATACAGSRAPDCSSTTVSSWPATTCAAVTTRSRRAVQPGALDADAAGGAEHAHDARRGACARPAALREAWIGRSHRRGRAR